jgi:hypothetical protein
MIDRRFRQLLSYFGGGPRWLPALGETTALSGEQSRIRSQNQ